MVFMYFVERPDEANKQQTKTQVMMHLSLHGFGHVFEEGDMVTHADMLKGPSGKPGTMVCAWPFYMKAIDVKPLTFNMQQQEWLDVGEGIWLGWERSKMPTPSELQRKKTVPGHMVKMNDGQEWLVPCARTVQGTTNLPQVMKLDDEGNVDYTVKKQYKQLFSDAQQIWDGMIEPWKELPTVLDAEVSISVTLSDPVLYRIGLASLSVNYRVGLHEVNALELFDTEGSLLSLAKALVDWPTVVEWAAKELQKKKGNNEVPADEAEVAPCMSG